MTPTKARYIRIPDDLWHAAMDRANAEGTTVSELIRGWLDLYVDVEVSTERELGRIIKRLKEIRQGLIK